MINSNMDPRSEARTSGPPTNNHGIAPGTWTSAGQWQPWVESMPVRCTTVFSDDGTITSKWEYPSDGWDGQIS